MSEGEARPRLVSVEPESHAAGEPRADSASGRRRRSRALVWVLGLAVAVLALLFALQLQRAAELAGQVESLSSELATSQRLVEAYQQTMDAVRGQVGAISEQIGSLQTLVSQDPEPAAPAEPTAP